MILGIDLGGSTTKCVLYDGQQLLFPKRLAAVRTNDALCALVADYLCKAGCSAAKIVLTGVGASFMEGNVLGLPTVKVDEFEALSRGAAALSGQPQGVVVSLGTGTAFLWVEQPGAYRHLGGTGVGGGTLQGLGRLVAGTDRADQLCELASRGDLRRVDLQMADMSLACGGTLPPELTASNFGKLSPDAAVGDFALGILNLVLQTAGTMAIFCCQTAKTDTVILTGTLAALPGAEPIWDLFRQVYPYRFIVPHHAPYATAYGAALCAAAAFSCRSSHCLRSTPPA